MGVVHQYKIILKKLKIMGLWIYVSLDVRFQTLSSSYDCSLPFTSPSSHRDYCLPACKNSISCNCLSCSQKLKRKGDSPNQKPHIVIVVVNCEWSAGSTNIQEQDQEKPDQIMQELHKGRSQFELHWQMANFLHYQPSKLLWRKRRL